MNWTKLGLIVLAMITISTITFANYTEINTDSNYVLIKDNDTNSIIWAFDNQVNHNLEINSPNNNTLYLIILFTIINIFIIIPKFKFFGAFGMIILGLLVLQTIDVNAIISYLYFGAGMILFMYDIGTIGKRS